MIVVGAKNSIQYTTRQENPRMVAPAYCHSAHSSQAFLHIVPPFTKINFRGKTPVALAEIPTIRPSNLGELVSKIKQSKKKPLVLSDYDGTHTDFANTRMSAIPTARPHIGEEAFLALNNTLNTAGAPLVILTTRSVGKLKEPTIMGEKVAEALNIVGLNGNQMRLTLDINQRSRAFIKEWAKKLGYKTSAEKLPDNRVKIKIDPIVPQELQRVTERFATDLQPLGFELNNESLILYFKWNKLSQAVKEASQEKPHVINVDNKVFDDVNTWAQGNKSNAAVRTISIRTEEGRTCALSYDELADYGLNKFKQICSEEYGDKLSSKKADELVPLERQNIKALVSDQKEKRFFEIADIRTKANNKGTSVEFLSKLFGSTEDSFPVFLGDSVSVHNDDEFGMKKTSELKGVGIAILKGNSKDDLTSRLALKTQADYKLESFEDTAPFLLEFAELFAEGKTI